MNEKEKIEANNYQNVNLESDLSIEKEIEVVEKKIENSLENNNTALYLNIEGKNNILDEEIEKEETFDLNLKRNFGNTFSFLFIRKEPLIVIGPDFKYFIINFGIVLFFYLIILYLKVNKKSVIFKYIFNFCFSLYAIPHLILLLMNPGIPKEFNINKEKKPEDYKKVYRQCSYCHNIIFRDSEFITFHCSDCDICIEDFDHHCPFSGKCIGKNNKIIFHIWLYGFAIFFVCCFVYIFI